MGDDQTRIIRVAREIGTIESPTEAPDLGQRVRALRKQKGWTLGQAALQAGLSRSTLSKIENGQMSPPFDALMKLAQGLSISVPQLFTPSSKAQVLGRMAVTKQGEGQPRATVTYEHELPAGAMTRKQSLPYRARIRARTLVEFGGWVRHDGEESCMS